MRPFATTLARDVLRVKGLDAETYLQGQISQDVAALVVRDSAWSFILQPQGKVDAWFRITRTAEDTFVLDVDAGWGEALATRLSRFKLRVKADIEALDWQAVAVRGVLPEPEVLRATGAELLIGLDWGQQVGVDLLGPSVINPAGVQAGTEADLERWRVAVGMPRMGAELDERTIPAEAGVVDRSVSFTKGCYTGQELVARIDSRGSRTPRRLRSVDLSEGGSAVPGDALTNDGREVGVITSVAGDKALAYVRREVEVPGRLALHGSTVLVEALPEV